MRLLNQVKMLDGIPVSPGIVIGRAYLVDRRKVRPMERVIDAEKVGEETERLMEAVRRSRAQLEEIKDHYGEKKIGEYDYLVDVHLMLLGDEDAIVRGAKERICTQLHSADWAVWETIQELKAVFAGMDDEYFRDRQNDVEHLGDRVLRNLVGHRVKHIADIKEDVVIVAHDLSPMDTAQMDVEYVRGFVTDLGGRTSHTAILAKALGIPAVVGLESITDTANGGDMVIVDGISGKVILNPDDEQIELYRDRKKRFRKYKEELERFSSLAAKTADEVEIKVLANIELLEELKSLAHYGAEGVGLYRTEFLYMNRDHPPTEEEHFKTYTDVANSVAPHPVTIRTLDLGGDKVAHSITLDDEVNPALGLRSIRLCLAERDIFKIQLRGLLRASVAGNIRVMFPMVSGMGELEDALAILEEVKEELTSEGLPFNEEVPVGIMVEVPSAALMAEILAEKVDFFSIGTNDLIQYALAIDRVNEHVAYLYEPLHPSVLRLIKMTVDAARNHGIKVSICGEMAGDELYTVVLLGLGVEELSMHPASIPSIKRIISRTTTSDARALARSVMNLPTAHEVHETVEWYIRKEYPGLLDPLGDEPEGTGN